MEVVLAIYRPTLILLSLLQVGLAVVSDGTYPTKGIPPIQWPAGCNEYSVTSGQYPLVDHIYRNQTAAVSECNALCTGKPDCGGFRVLPTGGFCQLYNINDQIINDYFDDSWYWTGSNNFRWSSKTCNYMLGDSDLECNSYTGHQYINRYISNDWMIMATGYITQLVPSNCHQFCTLYTGCMSVGYQVRASDGSRWCRLYNTTIGELLDAGYGRDVVNYTGADTWTTYDRYCHGDIPYVPEIEIINCAAMCSSLWIQLIAPVATIINY